MNFSIKPMLVTPKYAEELLKMNTNNRKVRQAKIDSLAESMKKGEWELSNDAIVISEGNVLLNGQHRLLAVIKSGVPCNFIIYTGAPDSAFGIMDTPALRSLADVVQHKGEANHTNTAATVNKLALLLADHENGYETTYRFSRNLIHTRKELIDLYERYTNDISYWLKECRCIYQTNIQIVPLATMVSFAVFLNSVLLHSEENILAFYKELLVDGACKNSTILYARKKFLRHKMKVETMRQEDFLRYIIRAWNDFILGKQVQIIKTNEDAFRYIKPV